MGSIDLRTASQQALAFIRHMNMHGWMLADYEGDMERVVQGLEAALAEPVQEPVEDIGLEWKSCVKLPITVHVRQQRPGETHVSTREGITPVKPDDLIMRGVSGEEYPIGREIFEATYQVGAAPPQRKPLTEEETAKCWHDTPWNADLKTRVFAFARAIEAKLQEKNT